MFVYLNSLHADVTGVYTANATERVQIAQSCLMVLCLRVTNVTKSPIATSVSMVHVQVT